MRESQVQAQVKRAYEKAGCFVAVFSQGRKTRQTPGIPDLYVFPPVRFGQDGLFAPAPFFHECKGERGKQRPEQRAWQERCAQRDVDYVLGGLDEALAHLKRMGYVR